MPVNEITHMEALTSGSDIYLIVAKGMNMNFAKHMLVCLMENILRQPFKQSFTWTGEWIQTLIILSSGQPLLFIAQTEVSLLLSSLYRTNGILI